MPSCSAKATVVDLRFAARRPFAARHAHPSTNHLIGEIRFAQAGTTHQWLMRPASDRRAVAGLVGLLAVTRELRGRSDAGPGALSLQCESGGGGGSPDVVTAPRVAEQSGA